MSLNRNQKLAAFFLSVLSLTALFVGVYGLYTNIYGTLKIRGAPKSYKELSEEAQIGALSYVLSLQSSDTDDDGLNDWDEMNSYNTSPYLKDSDSDGMPDKVELESGSDPMCHKDSADCAKKPIISQQNAEQELQQEANIPKEIAEQSPFNASSVQVSGKDLRQLLQESGFPKTELDKFTDEELVKTWGEVTGGVKN